ncbi:ribonuclease HI family protein [Candidatus Solincola tengchongensis]|uniref:ribonuclease HI family protein n=1 Tax=Candidatus Solincola tengchongensis TaxID=2900693 RepID=UPI00257B4C83|nr:ribonuclease HI family protein [Candidatus Solincola tengchongensis]
MERRKSRKSVVEPAFQGARRFEELHVFIDGAARGNPGPAAIGVVVLTRQGRRVAAFGEAIGEATNNFAEYTALVHALRLLSVYEVDRLRIYADSELVVRQIQGLYRVKERSLRSLHSQVMSMLGRYRDWSIQHIPREENREADRLANQALDGAADISSASVGHDLGLEEQPPLFPEEEEGGGG